MSKLNNAYKKMGEGLRPRSDKQPSAGGDSNYGSQVSYSASLHGSSGSWDFKPPRAHPGRGQALAVSGSWDSKPPGEHIGRDQARPVGGSWDGKRSEVYPERHQARAAGAPVDDSLYAASSAGASLERRADRRSMGLFFGRGTQDASQDSASMSASQGPMMGLSAVDPGFVGERRNDAGSSTNPFVSLGSRLPVTKADSIHSSRENHGKASSGNEPVAPTFTALLAEDFAAVIAKIPLQGEFSDALIKSVVSPSVSSGSIGSSMRSNVSKYSIDDDKASELLVQAEERKQQAALEATFAADPSHIVMHDLGTSGLRASVSTAPSKYCVEALHDIESLKIQLAKSQLDHDNCKLDLQKSELKFQKYNTEVLDYVDKAEATILGWNQKMFDLSLESADALETVLHTQERLIKKICEQECSLQACSLLLKKREEQIEELRRENAQVVDTDRAGFPRNGEWVSVKNPGEKLYIQRNVSLDAIEAMKILDKELLIKKLEEEKLKREMEEEILAEIVGQNVVQVVPEVFAEVRAEIVEEVPRKVVAEAGAGPVAQDLRVVSSPKEEKPSYEDVIEHLKKQSYSPDAFMRILEDESVVKELEPYPFFRAVFSSQALKQNLPRFCEDILREADQLWGRKLNIGNYTLMCMLRVILVERKPFSPERLQKFRATGDFHNSCIPTGKPTENINAFDGTAMSFEKDTRNFFKYFVTVYLTWGTDASILFAELVAQMQKEY